MGSYCFSTEKKQKNTDRTSTHGKQKENPNFSEKTE